MSAYKAVIILSVIVILISVICFPVSAANDAWSTFTVQDGWGDTLSYYVGAVENNIYTMSGTDMGGGVTEWQIPVFGDGVARVIFRRVLSDIQLYAGDTVLIHKVSGGVGGWLGGNSSNMILGYRWTLCVDGVGTVYGDWIDIKRYGGQQYNISWDDYKIPITSDVKIDEIHFEIRMLHPTSGILSMNKKPLTISYGNYSVYEYQQEQLKQQEETNEKLDQILNQPEQEKNEANSSGNSAVDDLTGALPDHSSGFISGFEKLVDGMSYSGTECVWKFPKLYIPAMSGVTDQPIQLMESELDIDIGGWVNKLPSNIMSLIRIVLTIALLIYCVKELYDTVQYVLTLRSGKQE